MSVCLRGRLRQQPNRPVRPQAENGRGLAVRGLRGNLVDGRA
ncbi:MAG: hypothetical protein AVDCRST_MAG89-2130 [uncultured Gemmatimonadetes bacterium]|uniref:Uncharacterized protein n=1 Tax=uncultured Gemmatimonadota bacterium TaxID=203437 RepID=A0A6J4LHW4_9BACT|nr:MAG: hypothetical protein AVDCRST_MAG89-2130 [uncultured Gemmatimonadota bacterium]